MTSKSLIYGVINDFPEAMHKSARVRCSDIHTWTFANCIKAFENCKIFSGVTVCSCCAFIIGGHEAQGYRADHLEIAH